MVFSWWMLNHSYARAMKGVVYCEGTRFVVNVIHTGCGENWCFLSREGKQHCLPQTTNSFCFPSMPISVPTYHKRLIDLWCWPISAFLCEHVSSGPVKQRGHFPFCVLWRICLFPIYGILGHIVQYFLTNCLNNNALGWTNITLIGYFCPVLDHLDIGKGVHQMNH